jgi:DNA mismatch repair protein MutL
VIHILPENIANKIAAGEVVIRPESVVKELLENALDAGARAITLQVKEGGTSLIQISDDGSGMGEEDAVLAFQRHATSKIAQYEDLEAIRTFGFRGEALASIAAVARVTLTTRRTQDDMAVVVKIDGGGRAQVSRASREPGTTVSVQHLFYNTPARRKFLKSLTTEFRHVYDAIHRIAISYPEIAIEFLSDGEQILNLKPAPLPERLAQIFGDRQVDGLIPVEERTEAVRISGFIGKPEFGQRTRAHQYLFLNRRFIVHRNIAHAVFSSYEHLLQKGSFPFFLLFVEIDPASVDVNIHPSKMEAKFEDEAGIYRMVAAMVRRALASGGAVPALSLGPGAAPGEAGLEFGPRQHAGGRSAWEFPERIDPRTGEITPGTGGAVAGQLLAGLEGRFQRGEGQEEFSAAERSLDGPVWQLHRKYLLLPIPSGLLVIDQHVAHERVLYEKILRRITASARASQQLLFPVTREVTAGDFSLLQEVQGELEAMGFELKFFGKNAVVIEGVPVDARPGGEGSILQETIDLYKEFRKDFPGTVRDNLAKSFACRSAVKTGDPLEEPEMRALLAQLFQSTMPYVCPHGRPVALRIPLEEMDRRFGRTPVAGRG